MTGQRSSEPSRENVLAMIVRDYAQHDSWRCAYPGRYPWKPDCPCGLTAELRRAKIDPKPWIVAAVRSEP